NFMQKIAPQKGEPQQSSQQGIDDKRLYGSKPSNRNVIPQQQSGFLQKSTPQEDNQQQQFSKLSASEAEFRQLIGEANEGTLARFVENKLNVLFWYRSAPDSPLIFGPQLAIPRLPAELKPLIPPVDRALREAICLAL